MALGKDHFHEVKWFKPKFKEHSATSDPSQANVRRLHFSEACTNALYNKNKDINIDDDNKSTYAHSKLWQTELNKV